MQRLEAQVGACEVVRCEDPWEALARAVVFQQVLGKTAAGLCDKMVVAFGGRFPLPHDVLAAPEGSIQALGMTGAKERTLRTLASAVLQGDLHVPSLATLEDDALFEALTRFKGVGRWTVEMFQVFHLGHEDVFMPGDVGLRNAIRTHYGLAERPTAEQAVAMAEAWRPYRTRASMLLWKSLPGFPEPGVGRGVLRVRWRLSRDAADGPPYELSAPPPSPA